jgi:hypothetical protein
VYVSNRNSNKIIDMPNWKKVIVSGSNASLNSLIVDNGITGSLFGTASFAVSASQATSASYAFQATSASYAISASQAISSSYTLSASYAATSSYATIFNVATEFTASGLNYPTVDGLEYQNIQTNGDGVLTFDYTKTLYKKIYNGETSSIVKGTPLYVSGSQGDLSIVYIADANNPARMPATVVAFDNSLAAGTEGTAVILGLIQNVNTTGYAPGTEVYVGVNGGWSATRPTGSAVVQSLGIVTREGTNGAGIVLTSPPNSLPNIQQGYVWIGDADGIPQAVATSSIQNVVSSSYASYASQALSSSYGATSSHADSFYVQDNAIISGSLTIYQNLTVFGSASITYVSESTLNIGTNLITVNSNTPAVRFGGLAVIDSGSSPQVSGSWLFDSIQNRWIMIHQQIAGSALTSSIGIMGPETYNSLGSETQITLNRLTKGYSGASGEHIGDSQISDDGTTVSIPGILTVTGSITGSLFGTASYATQALNASTASYVLNAISSSYATQALSASFASTSSFSLSVSGSVTSSMIANPGGNILLYPSGGAGIGTASVVLYGGIDWVRTPTAAQTEIGDLISFGGTMGIIDGGTLTTASALTIQVAESVGYVMTTGNYPNHNLLKINTRGTSDVSRQITLPTNSDRYIYYNSSGVLTSSATEPNSRFNVPLGRIITDSSSIIYIDRTPLDAHHYSNFIDRMFRDALGPIFQNGGITTEGTTPRTLNVTSATYFYSEHRITTTGATPITFDAYYRSGSAGTGTGGSGFARVSNQVTASNIYYDSASSGVLQIIPSGSYTKHSLYMMGAPETKYVLVYGQTLYDNAEAAESGELPTPPSFLIDQFALFSSIVVTPDSASLQIIVDERPRLGFASPSRTGVVTLHGNLLGLEADDHPQYLLVDGGREMSGDLGLGGNDLYNVDNISATSITSSLFGTASYATQALSASQAQNAVSSSYPITASGSTIYSATSNIGDFNNDRSILLGNSAGSGSSNAFRLNAIGNFAGFNATNAYFSNFIGSSAGINATNAGVSNFIGASAGADAINAANSIFIGTNAGQSAENAGDSVFIGNNVGSYAASASYSTLIGYNVGKNATSNTSLGIKSNNIIIGTNITLEDGRQDSINLGGLIFGTGSYSDIGTDPYSGSANGRIGINQPNPQFNFDVSGSGRYTNGLIISGSTTITGSLGVGTTGSAVVGRIDASNDVVAFSTSDRALKENLKPIANALYKLDNIQGYTFDWKDDENLIAVHGFRGRDIGVIAQEIEEILPEVVTTRDSGYKAVKYEKLVPFLIQCIKELKDEINELKGIEKPKKTRKTKPKNKPE